MSAGFAANIELYGAPESSSQQCLEAVTSMLAELRERFPALLIGKVTFGFAEVSGDPSKLAIPAISPERRAIAETQKLSPRQSAIMKLMGDGHPYRKDVLMDRVDGHINGDLRTLRAMGLLVQLWKGVWIRMDSPLRSQEKTRSEWQKLLTDNVLEGPSA